MEWMRLKLLSAFELWRTSLRYAFGVGASVPIPATGKRKAPAPANGLSSAVKQEYNKISSMKGKGDQPRR